MSRVKPGYFTAFNAFFTCSSEIDMHRNLLARRARSRWIGFPHEPGNQLCIEFRKSVRIGRRGLMKKIDALMRLSDFHR